MKIPNPRTTPADPNYLLDVTSVLEPYFQELAERAQAAGWSADVVAQALSDLATGHMQLLKAEAENHAAVAGAAAKHRRKASSPPAYQRDLGWQAGEAGIELNIDSRTGSDLLSAFMESRARQTKKLS